MTAVNVMKMEHKEAPEDVILKQIGDISDYELFHNRILVGVYQRPKKTAGGIHLPDQITKEETFQGKVGIVLKVGPGAFVDDQLNKFHGMSVKEGDWVVFRTSDGWPALIHGVLCRHLEDAHIVARVPSPDQVY